MTLSGIGITIGLIKWSFGHSLVSAERLTRVEQCVKSIDERLNRTDQELTDRWKLLMDVQRDQNRSLNEIRTTLSRAK